MVAGYPSEFLNLKNFELAWERIVRGSNVIYKRHFSHLFASYQFAAPTILHDLKNRIGKGHYLPSSSTTVYIPKPTRILRPITLITLNDQVVYQAIANYIARRFSPCLRQNYNLRTFGAQFAGRASKFFYLPWQLGYTNFNDGIRRAYYKGKNVLADFDLVSFFDLIDHKILRRVLETKITNGEILDLLLVCLEKWTARNSGNFSSGHGIPQGPEPSAFLADILLHQIDEISFPKATYLRYIDDIKLLARDLSPVRRALLKLDLEAKHLGLVPQAQKIDVRIVRDIEAELKTIPSAIADAIGQTAQIVRGESKVRRLRRFFRTTLERKRGQLCVTNETHFRYALYRMPRRAAILRLITPLLHSRPDLSPVLSDYLSRFPNSRRAASTLYQTIKSDPVFDATAGDYVLALDVCASKATPRRYTNLVSKLLQRSEEKSTLLATSSKLFVCKRRGKAASLRALETESNPVTAGKLINFFLLDPRHCFLTGKDLGKILKQLSTSENDEDLARYCTYLMLTELKIIPGRPRESGALLIEHLGFPTSRRTSLLAGFFTEMFGLRTKLDWERQLGKRAHSECQRRALLIRGRWKGDPSVTITVLDNFNDLLLQRFSRKHRSLRKPFRLAAGKNAIPDYGAWLHNPAVAAILPNATPILTRCHELRLRAEIAHATMKKTGRFTRAVTYAEKNEMAGKLRLCYSEWIRKWTKI